MKPITDEPVAEWLCVFIYVFVHDHTVFLTCICISCMHIQLIACQRGDISHLHTDARSPSVNDYEMEAPVRAGRTVRERRWSNSQLSQCCYEINAVGLVEISYLSFLRQQAAPWSPPEQAQITFMEISSIMCSCGTLCRPEHCSDTLPRALKIKFEATRVKLFWWAFVMINEASFRLVQRWKFINAPVITCILAWLSKTGVEQKVGEKSELQYHF